MPFESRKRYETINYFKIGNTNFSKIAQLVGLSRQQVRQIIKRFQESQRVLPSSRGKLKKLKKPQIEYLHQFTSQENKPIYTKKKFMRI